MNQPVEYYFDYFAKFYLEIYPALILCILAGTIILKEKYSKESFNLLFVCNTAVAWASFFIVLNFIMDSFFTWYGQNSYERFSYQTLSNPGSYIIYYFKIYLTPLVGLFFFFRRLRKNRIFTMLFLVCLWINFIYQMFSLYRDYLPSSWSIYRFESSSDKAIKYFVAGLFLIMIYIIARKRNKLPYPSVFLK